MRSTPIGGRPFPGFGYTGSMRAPSARHGTTRSISARNCARRVVFVYFSKPVPPSVNCERLFISTSRSHVMWLVASQHNPRGSGSLIQRFLKRPVLDGLLLGVIAYNLGNLSRPQVLPSRISYRSSPPHANAQLFFDVCAMKPPSCGTTFVPWHFGHLTPPFSRSEMVMITSKGLLHFSHTNS